MEALAYLDTHVALWLYAGEIERVSKAARRLIARAELRISPFVRFEMALLREIGRITESADTIVSTLTRELSLTICDAGFDDVVAEAMRCTWTRDPFDRVIVAQAAVAGARLLSKDRMILAHYARAVW